MANDYFRFKQFVVRHDRCAMKVGTDGVLLGCAVSGENASRALDVGTGTGLIAMMLAQRFPGLRVDAVDVDEAAVAQARENVMESVFGERICVERMDFNDVEHWERKYDLIVSNPPFYEEKVGCPDKQRDAARHTDSLPFERLIENAAKLLNEDGVFAVIIPSGRAADFILNCSLNRLYLFSRIDVKTTPRKEAKRCILQFSTRMRATETETLLLNNEKGERSEQYKELTKDFYL